MKRMKSNHPINSRIPSDLAFTFCHTGMNCDYLLIHLFD